MQYGTAALGAVSAFQNAQQGPGTKQQQTGAGINAAVDTVAGTLTPWYAAAKGLSDTAISLIPQETIVDPETGQTVTQAKSREGQALADTFTPAHETIINDMAEGNWVDAGLNTLTGGVYNTLDNYFKGTNKKEFENIRDKDKPVATSSGGTGAVMAKNGGRLPSYHQFPAIYPTYADNAGPMGQDLGNLYADGGMMPGPGDPPKAAATIITPEVTVTPRKSSIPEGMIENPKYEEQYKQWKTAEDDFTGRAGATARGAKALDTSDPAYSSWKESVSGVKLKELYPSTAGTSLFFPRYEKPLKYAAAPVVKEVIPPTYGYLGANTGQAFPERGNTMNGKPLIGNRQYSQYIEEAANSPEAIAQRADVDARRDANIQRFATEGTPAKETTQQQYARERAEYIAKNQGSRRYEQGGSIENVNMNLQPTQLPGTNMMAYGQQMYQPLDHVTQYGGNLYTAGGDLPPGGPGDPDFEAWLASQEGRYQGGVTNTPTAPTSYNNYQDPYSLDPEEYSQMLNAEEEPTSNAYISTLEAAQMDLMNAETDEEYAAAMEKYQSELQRLEEGLAKDEDDYKIKRNLGRDLMIAAPAVTNIATGLFERAEQLNPEEYMTPADLKAYQMNIDPLRRGIQQNFAQSTAAARNAGLPGGTYMANVGALNTGANRALYEAEVAKQNADAQSFAATQAANKQIESQNKQTKMGIKDFNLKSKAAKRQALTTGLTQLAQMGEGAYNLDAQMALAKAVSPTYGNRVGFDSSYWKQIQEFAKEQVGKAKTKKDITNEEINSK
jgi:hypothetical protein